MSKFGFGKFDNLSLTLIQQPIPAFSVIFQDTLTVTY